jgi:hypothetical protein
MARPKRNSAALATAQDRAAGLRSIDETLDFGDGFSLSAYQAKIQALQTKLTTYNTLLGTLDKLSGELDDAETELTTYSSNMLMCVATRYGKRSWEYGEAGGTNAPKRRKSKPSDAAEIDLSNLEMSELNGKVSTSAELSKVQSEGLN